MCVKKFPVYFSGNYSKSFQIFYESIEGKNLDALEMPHSKEVIGLMFLEALCA
jgi:hypothetical protein